MTGAPGGMPDLVSPMQVSAGSGQPPTGADWVVELAWTGHRCIAYVEPGRRTRLLSSGDVSMTAAYPELGPELERRSPPRGMVLDGTLVARGEEHAPRARLLQRRSARFRPSEAHIRDVPVDFQVADLLWLDGHSTLDLPYRDRRTLLEGLGFESAPVWTTSPLPLSELPTLLHIADAKGVDALHARHLGSRYRPGGRSPLWVKVPVPRTGQVIVGGWTPTDPARPDTIASLLLGIPARAGLHYIGRVGVVGDQRRQVAALRKLTRGRSPFGAGVPADVAEDAIWVEPRLVGLVEFTGFTAGGRLRLPYWRGPVAPDDVDDRRWARPPEPPQPRTTETTVAAPPEPTPPVVDTSAASRDDERLPEPEPPTGPGAAGSATAPTRRLEQHFVYNALNTIAAMIRTDPGRARELLYGFADLSRAADQPGDATSTLGKELAAVQGYLQLEQARFGRRLRVQVEIDDRLHALPIAPMHLLATVREIVQQGIEPLPEGGLLSVSAREADGGCVLTVAGGLIAPVLLTLPGAGVALPS